MILETLLALTPIDYDHLARAVSVEAAPNTMDEHCVAISILNRVRSPHYPNTVADVVYAPGQYEGFYTVVQLLRLLQSLAYWIVAKCFLHTVLSVTELISKDNVCYLTGCHPKIQCVTPKETSFTITGNDQQNQGNIRSSFFLS